MEFLSLVCYHGSCTALAKPGGYMDRWQRYLANGRRNLLGRPLAAANPPAFAWLPLCSLRLSRVSSMRLPSTGTNASQPTMLVSTAAAAVPASFHRPHPRGLNQRNRGQPP
ncbi:hypothetical protein LY78DRAFT_276828 [Colletotrichum sublineola]|nr:hypothetical protein LY78DRAFT_276828 [Colletotrichum sublineola]